MLDKKILIGATTVALAATYVIYDNEFRLAFDRYYHFPDINNAGAMNEEYGDIEEGKEFLKTIPSSILTIKNDLGSTLSATFIPAKEQSNKYVLFSHGYRNNGINEFAMYLQFYYGLNVNMILVDHQAHGCSEGTYITFGYQEAKDLVKWMLYIVQQYGSDIELYLHGISMGSATVLHASQNAPKQVKGIISDCGYINTKDQLCTTMKRFHAPLKNTTYKSITKKLNYVMKSNIDEINNIEAVKKWEKQIYFIHGEADNFVPVQNGIDLYNACSSQYKKLLLVPNAKHAQNYRVDPEGYQKAIKEILGL